MRRAAAAAIGLLALLGPAAAAAQAPGDDDARFEIRDEAPARGPALTLGAWGAFGERVRRREAAGSAAAGRGYLDLGAALPVGGEGGELFAAARLGLGGGGTGGGALAGYRATFGADALQTYADVALQLRLAPGRDVGPRFGFGLRRALGPRLWLTAGGALGFALGGGLRYEAELGAGLAWHFAGG